MKQKKFYQFKNNINGEADLYLYGEIVLEKGIDFWTGQESETEIGLMEFKEELDNLKDVKKLNIYINSPGGDVFVTSTMSSMLQRQQSKGITIHAYVDGLAASAASWLMFVADQVYLYKNSTVMIHKPMSVAIGNSNDLQKTIDTLDKIEESVMIPLYMSKSKIDEETLKQLINDETWFSASDMQEYFDVIVLDEQKTAVACCNSQLLKTYKNTPDFILKNLENKKINSMEPIAKQKVPFACTKVSDVQIDEDHKKERARLIKIKMDLLKNTQRIKERNKNE